jgi:HSP20 family molecular chaperone IbpA
MKNLPSEIEKELKSYLLDNFPEIYTVNYEISEDGTMISVIVEMAYVNEDNFDIAIPAVEKILDAKFQQILILKGKQYYNYIFNK